MANFNKVILAGNLTRDPQLSHTPSQVPVCEFGMAINRKYKSGDGQQREETCFVECQAWRRTAEIINQYMSKGRPILVEGRLTFDAWEDKDGQKHSRLRVTVLNFQFLGSPGGGGQGGGGQGGGYQQQRRSAPQEGDYPPPPGDYSAPPQQAYDDVPEPAPPEPAPPEPAPPEPAPPEPAPPEAAPPEAGGPGGDNIPF